MINLSWGAATLPEIIWTLGATFGFSMVVVITYPNAIKARIGLEALGENGFAQSSAEAIVFGELVRGFMFIMMASIGFVAMLSPTSTPTGDPTLRSWFIMIAFLAMQLALHAWSINDIRTSRRIVRVAGHRIGSTEAVVRIVEKSMRETDE